MELSIEKIKGILKNESLLHLASTGSKYPDSSVVCFAYDDELRLYFGSYSDTLKCKNIAQNPYVAITVKTLQIHGIARIIPYQSKEYQSKLELYARRFPQYVSLFEKVDNELYEIMPLVIWNYNPGGGEMHRDVKIFDQKYYDSIEVYQFHNYENR